MVIFALVWLFFSFYVLSDFPNIIYCSSTLFVLLKCLFGTEGLYLILWKIKKRYRAIPYTKQLSFGKNPENRTVWELPDLYWLCWRF